MFAKQCRTMEQVVGRIIDLNEQIRDFWSNSRGWAPPEAAELLSKSRLDWQVSLSYTLNLWLEEPAGESPDHDGRLILAWADLGTLVENTLKFFLSVYYNDYIADTEVITEYNSKTGQRETVDPDSVKFEKMRIFFKLRVWSDNDKKNRDEWILKIQKRRNAIHAYRDRDLGTFGELHEDFRRYLAILEELFSRVPWPDYGSPPF